MKKADDIRQLVERELALITDARIRDGLSVILVPPEPHVRRWDYGVNDERFECWTVAKHVDSDTALVFSEHGFGPLSPWGLVRLSDEWFGMDSGWFRHLAEAFLDSFAAADLPIWSLVEKRPNSEDVLSSGVSADEAFSLRDKLEPARQARCHVVYRG